MRNCETVGIPSMFRSRVMGVGSQTPGGPSPYEKIAGIDLTNWKDLISKVPMTGGNTGIGGYRAQVCHPDSPAGTCKPVDWKPDAVSTPAPTPAPAKPTGSALPLLIGAAFLLLS